ncbi:MAG: DNA polymerase III subunit gamma/tau [Oscillospiraceae bacterium]
MYLALYRKYRPKTFDDVISQEHITTTLKNQITNGTTAHAYLFTGSRGTGKTTCAKILAMAMNCLSPRGGNPCLECESCRQIAEGAVTDIVEMDAASNNGVDDVRALRDEVAYTPVSCKYRVYIIDEVHMLSINAFNALLKTLEEPPPHVKFILATTELHKVPATIISRCQRMEFRRIDIHDSAERLLAVAEKEGAALDADAAELISRLSDGGMRDALSVLDRCLTADARITTDTVREYAGVADNRHLFSFTEMIANGDASGCIKLLAELHSRSKDIARIIDELSMTFRDLMLYKTIPADTGLLSAMPCDHAEIARLSEMFPLEDILRCLTLLRQCADSIGKTKQRRTVAEMCLVRMCLKLPVQDDSAPRTSPAPPRPNTERAPSAPTGPQASPAPVSFVEIPQEKFEPTPLKDLSPQNAANISRIRELRADTEKTLKQANALRSNAAANDITETAAKQAAPAQAEKEPDVFAPPPVMNAAPAAPQDNSAPLPEEPPVEYIPQREFETAPPARPAAPEPIIQPAPASEDITPKAAVPEKSEEAEDKAQAAAPEITEEAALPEETKPAPEKANVPENTKQRDIKEITPEEWQSALDKISDVMLLGSTVRSEGDTLVVSVPTVFVADKLSSNPEEQRIKTEEICEALGIKTAVRFECSAARANASAQAENNSKEVRKLLNKAEQLDIEVIIK